MSINEPIAPDLPDPLALNQFHTADVSDDDGQAIDDYFESAYQGPPLASESAEYEELTLPSPTRMIGRTVVIGTVNGTLYDPVLLLPADVNRVSLHIDATASIQLSAEKIFPGAAVTNYPWTDTEHTGAIWVWTDNVNSVTVSVWSVVKA